MPDPETPVLHLGLSSDARLNRNWQILDDAIHRLAGGVQIADDLSILGSLDVRDDATIHGHLSAGSISTGVLTASEGTFSGMLTAQNGLTVANGPLILPDGSLDGADFMKGATVQAVGVSTAFTGTTILGPTAIELNRLTMPAVEDAGRWELLVVQATFRFTFGGTVPVNMSLVADILNKGATLQSRTLSIAAATAGAPNVDIPLTMVRIMQPTAPPEVYTLWASRTITNGSPTASCVFAQLHCLQLR